MEHTPPPPPPAPQGDFPAPLQQDSTTMALLCHLLAIFTGFIAPLIIWLIKKDTDPFVDAHGKEALNFQISVIIYYVVSAVLMFVVIGVFTFFAVFILDLVCCILATMAASRGEGYRYPLCIRFIS